MSDQMIELADITKDFGRGVRALDGVTLQVRRGEFVAVVGASGSGKTTLLQILGCLDVPTSGRYVLDGVRVDQLDDDALSALRNEKIGFVFQSFNLVPRTTAVENVETPLLYARRPPSPGRARELLTRVGLGQRMHHFPPELSGGEQQRVAIARALVMRPALLLADEPTGNLDSANGEEILTVLSELHADGLTMVLVTHDPDVAARAERTITLQNGRVAGAPALHRAQQEAAR